MQKDFINNLFSLEGKTVLVTGAGRGIGQVVARDMARAGANIAIFSRSGADETVRIIEAEGGKAISIIADCTKEEEVKEGMQKILDAYGRLDVVFNNAGICYHKGIFEATYEEFRELIDINLTGEYIVAVEAARVMIELGCKGSIINMASISGTVAMTPQKQAAYNASKAGVMQLTKSMALELADHNIRVNSISPGYIATPMSVDPDFVEPELMAAWEPLMPMHRMAKPEELVGAIIWLASEASSYTNGIDVIIDGLYTAI